MDCDRLKGLESGVRQSCGFHPNLREAMRLVGGNIDQEGLLVDGSATHRVQTDMPIVGPSVLAIPTFTRAC
jgi:hypothetical protein